LHLLRRPRNQSAVEYNGSGCEKRRRQISNHRLRSDRLFILIILEKNRRFRAVVAVLGGAVAGVIASTFSLDIDSICTAER